MAVAAVASGCASGRHPVIAPPAEILAHGERAFDRGRFRDAEAVFKQFLDHYPGDPAAPRVQLGLARSILGEKEYERARTEFTALTERYPDSPEMEEARYYVGVAYARESLPAEMDQAQTRKALDEIEAYLADFPAGRHRAEAEGDRSALREKLAEKDVRNGNLYLKMGYPEAAAILFQGVLDRFGDTTRADRARFGLAEALRAEGKRTEASALYRRLLESGAAMDLRRECERRLREMG
jgi:outer membrane protein assembly factor BamD